MERLRFDAGLTLDTPQRYSDQQFRRLSRWFWADRVDQADGVALLVALKLLDGKKAANAAFHWSSAKIWRQIENVDYDYADAYVETLRDWSPKHSVALMKAMRDGGWKRGPIPPIVRQSMKALRKSGTSWAKIAKLFGVTPWQAEYEHKTRAYREARDRANAAASL